jgi:hypothetical protein
MIISHSFILVMRNVSDKCREIKTHILCPRIFFSFFFSFEKRIVWDNVQNIVQTTGQDDNIRRMRFASWITNSTDTLAEYAIIYCFFHCNNVYAIAPRCCVYTHIGVSCASLVFLSPVTNWMRLHSIKTAQENENQKAYLSNKSKTDNVAIT